MLYQWPKFQCHTFPSQDIKQNVLLNSYLNSCGVINFKIYLRSSSQAMADREKRGKGENKKFEYLENKKELFR